MREEEILEALELTNGVSQLYYNELKRSRLSFKRAIDTIVKLQDDLQKAKSKIKLQAEEIKFYRTEVIVLNQRLENHGKPSI